MNNTTVKKTGLEKLGGIAAIYGALVYIVAMIVFLVVLDYPNVTEPAQKVDMIVNNQNIIIVLHWLSYIIFGLLLVILSLALYEKIRVKNTPMMKIATVFGIIWATLLIASGLISIRGIAAVVGVYNFDAAQAALLWQSIEVSSSALSFADGEILGGLWMFLVGLSALKASSFSKALNIVCIGVGIVGIISIIPFLNLFSALFGLGQIVWFIWLGITLVKG